jgi:hypothetical protein
MRRIAFAPAVAATVLAAAALLRPTPAQADGSTPPHLTWCASLTDTLRQQTLAGFRFDANGLKLNEYVGDRLILFVEDGAPLSENRTLCNQHVIIQLRHAYNWDDATFKAKFGSSWPTAEGLYNDVVIQRGFSRVATVLDIQPGDIFAINYHDDPNANYPTVTGHTGIINSVGPQIAYTFPSNGQTVRFRDLEVFDSTSSVHSLDNRIFQAGELGAGSAYTEWSGAGRGFMRIYVDANDNYLGYTWSMTGNKAQGPGTPPSWSYYSGNFKPESLRHWAVGRVTVP